MPALRLLSSRLLQSFLLFSFYGEGEHKRKKTVAVADTAVQLANALACKALAKYFSINDAQTLKRKNKQKKKKQPTLYVILNGNAGSSPSFLGCVYV